MFHYLIFLLLIIDWLYFLYLIDRMNYFHIHIHLHLSLLLLCYFHTKLSLVLVLYYSPILPTIYLPQSNFLFPVLPRIPNHNHILFHLSSVTSNKYYHKTTCLSFFLYYLSFLPKYFYLYLFHHPIDHHYSIRNRILNHHSLIP